MELQKVEARKMLSKDEKKVIAAILEGAEHPRSMEDVARVTNMDARKVRLIVTSLAARSYPIGGNHHKPTGYFWATNDEELELAIIDCMALSRSPSNSSFNSSSSKFNSTFGIMKFLSDFTKSYLEFTPIIWT